MKELVRITEHDGQKAVSARELHKFLEATERFQNWFDRQVQYGFIEGVDYVGCKEFNALANQELTDYILTIDCAKEISMLQRSERGKLARQYFIACEQKLKEIAPRTYKEALLQLVARIEENERLQSRNRETTLLLEEKTRQLDQSKEWMTIKRFAKECKIDWREINWRKLKALSAELGYKVKKIFDANYGEVNLYHVDVFNVYFHGEFPRY